MKTNAKGLSIADCVLSAMDQADTGRDEGTDEELRICASRIFGSDLTLDEVKEGLAELDRDGRG